MCSALSGVGFCLDFSPFLSSSLVTLLGVFLLFIYLFNGQTQDFDIKFFFALQISLINPKRKEKLDQISFFFFQWGQKVTLRISPINLKRRKIRYALSRSLLWGQIFCS